MSLITSKCFTIATDGIPIWAISVQKNLKNCGFKKKPLNKSVHFYLTRPIREIRNWAVVTEVSLNPEKIDKCLKPSV